MKNKKGFTLIELLAVVVILGIIMAIAVPSVQTIIINSKKDSYIQIVKEYKNSISLMISSEQYEIQDPNTVYYFDYKLAKMESEKEKSPFGKLLDCYVVVTWDGQKANYYWTGVDEAGMRIDPINYVDDLTSKDIYHTESLDVSNSNYIGARDNIIVYKADGSKEEKLASNDMTSEAAKSCFSFLKLADGTYSITNYDVNTCGKVVNIPSTIDGKTVTVIDENAFRGKGITDVTLYYGIKEIRYGAFQNNKIVNLKLAASIKKIDSYAFYNNKIETLILPEGIEVIETMAFRQNEITSISFPRTLKTIGASAFKSNKLTEIKLASNATIGSGAFSNNLIQEDKAFIFAKNGNGTTNYSKIISYAGSNKDVIVPEETNGVKLTTIGSGAFESVGLTSIILPNTVTSIESSAFYSNKLTSITLPSSLKSIGGSAFRSNRLTDINIPDSVTTIGGGAFRNNCITKDNSIMYARTSSGTWDYSTIVSLTGGSNCNITTITIPATKNGVTLNRIVSSAFEGSGLKKINLPNLSETPNLTVDDGAFNHNNVTDDSKWFYKIKNGAIDYSYLSSYMGNGTGMLVIPETAGPDNTPLKTIASGFTWKSYSGFTIPSTVTTLPSGVFSKTALCNQNLVTIINKTGKEFNWYQITGSTYTSPGKFKTGTVKHQAGNIEIIEN